LGPSVNANRTEPSPEIRGKLRYFNRVLMSYIDFQQAQNIAHVILRDRLHKRLRDPGPGDRFLLQGLNCAMIVAYCRPFSGNDRGATVKVPGLPARFLRVLNEEERWLHGIVMKDRDSRLAHSDSEAWDMEPVVFRLDDGYETLIPMHDQVHAPLTLKATECFQGMADKLRELCFAERLRLEPELRPYFRVLDRNSEELQREISPPGFETYQ
jgi:hypothetical protein